MPALVVLTCGPALLGLASGGPGGPPHVHAQIAAAASKHAEDESAREEDETEDQAEKARDRAEDGKSKQKDDDDRRRDEDDGDDEPSTPAPAPSPGSTVEHGLVAPVTATRTVSGVEVDVPQAGSPLPLLPAALLGAGGTLLLVAGRRIGRARS